MTMNINKLKIYKSVYIRYRVKSGDSDTPVNHTQDASDLLSFTIVSFPKLC